MVLEVDDRDEKKVSKSPELLAQGGQKEHKTADQWMELERKMQSWVVSFWALDLAIAETMIGFLNELEAFAGNL